MNAAQIATLTAEYSKIERVTLEGAAKIRALLNNLTVEVLKDLMGRRIKWISSTSLSILRERNAI